MGMTAQDTRKKLQNVNVETNQLDASVVEAAPLVAIALVVNVQNHANATLVNVANAVMTAQDTRKRLQNVNVETNQLAANAVEVAQKEVIAPVVNVQSLVNATLVNVANAV